MGILLTDKKPGYELVADVVVSVACTSVLINGLNITKDDDYLLVSDVVNPTGDNAIYLLSNGNITNTNYYNQNILADNTSKSGARANTALCIGVYSGTKTSGSVKIKLTNGGYFVYQSSQVNKSASSTLNLQDLYGSSTFTMTSITSLTLTSSNAGGIGVGSRFQLYKRVATLLADVTISTATTSVDFTGLDIGKDDEVMLVVDGVGVNGFADSYLTVNNNNTLTNYYSQLLLADGATVNASRENTPKMSIAYSNYKGLSYTKIKLSNNGYYVYQADTVNQYPGVYTYLVATYGSSTFTTSAITQLTITASRANSIGIGSRFQLYKMK